MNTKIKTYVNELIGNKENPVILEIGAHYGEDTMDMMHVFRDPIIHCFDPHPGNIEFMRNIFKDISSIHVYELALSDFDGKSSFQMLMSPLGDNPLPNKYSWIDEEEYRRLNLNDSGGSSLKKGYRNNDCKEIEVETIRLDTWNEDIGLDYVDFMWIDVQGAEKEVVQGGEKLIKNTSYIWVEYGERFYKGAMTKPQTVELFSPMGFTEIKSDRHNILFGKS